MGAWNSPTGKFSIDIDIQSEDVTPTRFLKSINSVDLGSVI